MMVSHHPAKFGSHSHCGSGDKMFRGAGEKDSRCFALIRHYSLSPKDMGWNYTGYHINNSDAGHALLEKNLKITFAIPSKNAVEKNEQQKIMTIAKLFCITRKMQK